MEPIIIIGSGLAGYNLAHEIRKNSREISIKIITANKGDYYSKPLLSRALTNKTKNLITKNAADMSKEHNMEAITNTKVLSIDIPNSTITTNNGNFRYSKLVLALGASPIDFGITSNVKNKIISINDLYAYKKFHAALAHSKHVTILGSGLIGCELANDMLNIGIKVSIISNTSVPLKNLVHPSVSELLVHSLHHKGASWYWDDNIDSIQDIPDNKIEITLSSGTKIETDLLIPAIGIKPNIDLVQAAAIKTNRGIVTNQYLETSAKNIYAIGDCAEVCNLLIQRVQPINYQVHALAKTLTGNATKVHYPPMPISIKTPACPVVVSPLLEQASGDWEVNAAGQHIKALYTDEKNNILAFTLTGDRIKDKLELTTLMKPVLAAQS